MDKEFQLAATISWNLEGLGYALESNNKQLALHFWDNLKKLGYEPPKG